MKKSLMKIIARIWSVPIIVFALIFLVGHLIGGPDPNAVENYPFIENLPPIFILIAVLGLALAWKWEKIGGIITIGFCAATLPILFIHWPIIEDIRFVIPYILLSIIAIPGVLFFVNSYRNG